MEDQGKTFLPPSTHPSEITPKRATPKNQVSNPCVLICPTKNDYFCIPPGVLFRSKFQEDKIRKGGGTWTKEMEDSIKK